ncbi:MAG: S16 family serine protease [Thermoplasmata archaeon]
MNEKIFHNRCDKEYIIFLYRRYVEHVISYEGHIERIYNDWVIDATTRNAILQRLNELTKKIKKIYKMKCRSENGMKSLMNENSEKKESQIALDKTYTFYQKSLECLKLIEILEHKKVDDPFITVKRKLLSISREYGYTNIDIFLRLYFGECYTYLFSKAELEILEIYNKLFIPLSIVDDKNAKEEETRITISKIDLDYDSLIDNTCSITLSINRNTKIIFSGYVSGDLLNILIRTSHIYSSYLSKIKSECRNILKRMYPEIDREFFSRYIKASNSNIFFTNNVDTLVDKIVYDYHQFNDLSSKSFNSIMKEFVHSTIKNMYRTINLLLMGNKQNVRFATLLFEILKYKKVSGEAINEIIYHHLSFYSQLKLNKTSNSIKSEILRIRTLSSNDISIEEKLAAMVNMPDNVKIYILERLNEMKSSESSYKIQLAIEGLMQFPWKPKDCRHEFFNIRKSIKKSRVFLQHVARKLDEQVYGQENSKKALIELVGKWIQNPESSGQVIGLQGPPGIGKTLLAKSISSALGIPLVVIGLGGMNDAADLVGHNFTYSGAQYGMIVRQMIKAGSWRCIMFFDELDKVSKRNDTNEIYSTLIHITDPNMNQHFQDRFYSSSIEFDLSGVLFIFSYNDSSKIDPILFDRFTEIRISIYSVQEKIVIAQNYLLKELCQNIGIKRDKIQFDNEIIRYIIENYTVEAGVRELRRKLEKILLKLNIDRIYLRGPFFDIVKNKCFEKYLNIEKHADPIDSKENDISQNFTYKNMLEELLDKKTLNEIFNMKGDYKIMISRNLVHRYLEKPTIMAEEIHKHNMVGVVNGLYATSLGMGGIIPIQIYRNFVGSESGMNFRLKLTGNQKKVMKESVACALTAAINLLNNDIKNEVTKKFPFGFHIHVPDGGTPKDGPSAGCAFAIAFVSIILNKKVSRRIAVTGEIDLTGKVSKVGGLDIKLMGAKKAGIRCTYISVENQNDYYTIKTKNPELFDNNFKIKIVEHLVDIVTDPNVIPDISNKDFDNNILKNYKKNIPSKNQWLDA